MDTLWLLDFAWPATGSPLPATLAAQASAERWRSVDGQWGRAYLRGAAPPGDDWIALEPVRRIDGASAGEAARFHYAVEADIAPEHEADFNGWYENEHLPGLAAVPGTIVAARYRRSRGAPRYIACYHLTADTTLQRPEWLAVRHTPWSDRVRPLFLNTRRTMFVPA